MEPKINVKHNSLVYQRSLPEKNPFPSFPDLGAEKAAAYLEVIWVGYLGTLRLGLWEPAENFFF